MLVMRSPTKPRQHLPAAAPAMATDDMLTVGRIGEVIRILFAETKPFDPHGTSLPIAFGCAASPLRSCVRARIALNEPQGRKRVS